MDAHSEETRRLLDRIRLGDAEALSDLFARHRPRLRAMVCVRLDARLQGRIDPSDVLQDAYLDAAARLDGFLASANLPPFLWLRLVVGERLLKLHRHHLGTQRRDAGREVSLSQQLAASSAALAAHLADDQTSPSQAAVKAERALRLQQALDAMHPDDREILALRQFEELTAAEAAAVLGIEEAAAAKRYIRAVKRLKLLLAQIAGGPQDV